MSEELKSIELTTEEKYAMRRCAHLIAMMMKKYGPKIIEQRGKEADCKLTTSSKLEK